MRWAIAASIVTATATAPSPAALHYDGCVVEASRLPAQATVVASYYHRALDGRETANGERYDQRRLTAAHRSLPFGTRLLVRSMASGREVIVRVNDRGPYWPGRDLDLSRAAARRLGMIKDGIEVVTMEVIG